MSTFFQQTAQTMIAKHIDRFVQHKRGVQPDNIVYITTRRHRLHSIQ